MFVTILIGKTSRNIKREKWGKMKRLKGVLILFLAGSILGAAGCSENTLQQKEAKASETAQIKAVKKKVEKPVWVRIIDPETKKEIKSFIPKDYGFGTDDDKYKAAIAEWAREMARGTNETPGYDKRMILDKLKADGQVIKGSPQTILEEQELIEKVLQASVKGGDVEVPLYVSDSGYSRDEASQLNEVVVASFTTYFNNGVTGRTTNIALSAQAINNTIIGKDDPFSFNTTVGPSDADHGYQKAPEALNGKLVEGIGGGICQTSSTLYNAIDQLAVSYIEKHHHSLHVGYVPKGRDATVSYGGKDFRFKNTTGVPLLLKAYMGNGSLTVEVRTSRAYQTLIKKAL